jgi:hypothetical protein
MIIPDKWLVLKVSENLYKIFATWNGSYLGCDEWKLNSGIESVEEDEKEYRFYGVSGSCYYCNKNSYGSTLYGYDVLKSFTNKIVDKIEVLGNCNWVKFFNNDLNEI